MSEETSRKTEPKCTTKELENILTLPSGGLMMMPCNDMDNVYEGLYIGDKYSGKNIRAQLQEGINHVLNTATGVNDEFHMNTDPKIYERFNIKYMCIEASDTMNFKIDQYFEETANFIDEGIKSGGKVLVHCIEGFSRSSTIALAYLMLKQHMTVQEATRHVRQFREIGPNDGFLQQLCDLNERLWEQGHFKDKDVKSGTAE